MTVATVSAAVCRLRIRRPLLVVREGPWGGVPLSPLLFLGAVAFGLTAAWAMAYPVHSIPALGYPVVGGLWFVALWSIQPTVITEYGIVPDVRCMECAVPWGRVVDYSVSRDTDDSGHFIFFYRNGPQAPPARVDVHVPAAQRDALTRIVQRKLDARFAMAVQRAYRTPSSAQ
ncbi:hypothetical protein CRI93_10280 [Longimonas halophila]|uniref:DUF304 domain-containing protein n=1 Tax=Longimonas halophila TaxID=1469170 RepID=A0A2H3NK34_9BACT|nr:hypothetical protein [Longimonas halophila]PEN06205.1 hypothetical protein CRI93_10280 [Longimonas halophila]